MTKNKQSKQARRDARQDAREDKREVRKATRETKKGARQDKRETRKDARQDAKETKNDARADARDLKADARGGTKTERKDARQDAKATRKDGRQGASATKKSARRQSRNEAREEITTAKDDKREAIADIKDEKKETIAATRRGWSNWLDDLQTDADRVDSPTTIRELRRVIEAAVADDARLKPVGSGHSYSNAAQPSARHRYVDLSQLTGLIDTTAEREAWRGAPDESPPADLDETDWVRVKAGTRIQELTTQLLPPLDLGLPNMGTFDGQTVSGAVNTGTHGTGLGLGSFGDMVRSADLFVIVPDKRLRPTVELWRLEPKNGPTDPAAASTLGDVDRLVQDDELFHAMVVGFGAFGIAYSYLLAVRPYYWLEETAEQTTVEGLKDHVISNTEGKTSFLDARNPWAFVNVAWAQVDKRRKGDPGSLDEIPVRLARQNLVSPKPIPRDFKHEIHPLWPPMRRRDNVIEGAIKAIALGRADSGTEPGRFIASSIDDAFIEDDSKLFFHEDDGGEDMSAYYRVIRRVRDNSLKPAKNPGSTWDNSRLDGPPSVDTSAISFDVSVPLDHFGTALDTILAECEAETIKLNVPMGIRFTAGSRHMMSASYGRESALFELAGPVENKRQLERDLQRYKRVLSVVGAAVRRDVPAARPHLGKHHGLDHASLLRHYPRAEEWLKLQGLFNFTGTWTSPFTDEFDGQRYRRSARDARNWLEQRLG